MYASKIVQSSQENTCVGVSFLHMQTAASIFYNNNVKE